MGKIESESKQSKRERPALESDIGVSRRARVAGERERLVDLC